MEKQDFVARTK
ncbi:Protein of unknown function [Leuconostoc citreum LBAE C11]|nr:Protein of unknown function [Leuconostoc citreum LBAE C11]